MEYGFEMKQKMIMSDLLFELQDNLDPIKHKNFLLVVTRHPSTADGYIVRLVTDKTSPIFNMASAYGVYPIKDFNDIIFKTLK